MSFGEFNEVPFNVLPFNAPGDPGVQIVAPTQTICIPATAEWERTLKAEAIWQIEIKGEVSEC